MARVPALLADIGGTNARFALSDEAGGLGEILQLPVGQEATAEAAIAAALDKLGTRPALAAIAVAGPVAEGQARLTNGVWRFDAAALAKRFGFARVLLVNDFAAQAWALPCYGPAHLHRLGGEAGVEGAPKVVLGPGTGLGLAAWLGAGGAQGAGQALVGEGGHVGLAAESEREAAVIARLRRRYGHVSAERLLSGPGLVELYATLAEVEGRTAPPRRDPAEITDAALAGNCPASMAALALFFAWLGGFAGDAALLFGARGGVYLGGGILPRLAGALAASDCRARFEAKGRLSAYLAPIPLYLIDHPQPGLLGLSALVGTEGRSLAG